MTDHAPVLLLLDVNETLSDMRPLADRLERVGGRRELLGTWFAGTLRDGIALTAAGAYASFPTVARDALAALLAAEAPAAGDSMTAAEQVLQGMDELSLHPDVRPGLERIHAGGTRLAALTNGTERSASGLLERGGVADIVERCISVEEVRRWKPAREPYRHALRGCGVPASQAMLAAAHPWDVDGAKRAGLGSAWINRRGVPFPLAMKPPDIEARDFVALAEMFAS